jgi:hypothetical protein
MSGAMKQFALCALLLGSLLASASVLAEPEVREHAVEQIMPGIFVRDTSGVTIDLGERRCDPLCAESEHCEPVCVETACGPSEALLARCNSCAWQCR